MTCSVCSDFIDMARGPHRHGTASVTEEETLRDVAGWLGELKKRDKFSSKALLNVSIFQYFLRWPSQRRTATLHEAT